MAQRVTLREVARLAGVHHATASRALNEETRGLVAEETARRVEEAARTLRYRPNHLARSLKTQRSSMVGVVVPDLTNPLFPPIVRGIEDRLDRHGYVALVGNTDDDDERERRVVEGMRARSVDGLIVATTHRHHHLLIEVARSGLALVLVNRVLEDRVLPSVSVDDQMGVRAAVSHLVDLGHRRIAHVAGPQQTSTGNRRYLGFLAGVESGGLDSDPALVAFAESYSEAEGFRCAGQLFASRRRFSAIVAGNDVLALGVLRAMTARGASCPRDCSVVGFNDIPLMDRISPPLTTIRLPHYDVGFQAAHLLLERIDDTATAVKILFLSPELVVRASTAPPPRR